jgi:uncharacterized membrane protein YfcA
MELMQAGALGLVGVAAGWINVMAGGGSLLTVPMMLFFGLPGPVANATNRIGVITQNIAAVGAFRAKGFADFRLSATLALATLPGAVLGAWIGSGLRGAAFERTVAVIMGTVLVLMLTGLDKAARKPGAEDSADGQPRNLALGHLLMVAVGFWGGFIQIGVGFLVMPVLHRVMGFDLVRVNMHKVAIVLAFTVAALAVFALAGVQIAWIAGLALAAGNALGGWIGAHTTIAKGEVGIRRVFYLAIIGLIVKLVFF